MFKLGLMCCDSAAYLWLANQCAAKGLCWDELRPVGMLLYAALPIVIWQDVQMIVLINMIVIAACGLVTALGLGDLFPATRRVPLSFLWRLLIAAAGCAAFMWGDVKTPLSDVPSAAFALMGVWLFIMGCRRKKTWLLGAGGLLVGFSAIVRIFYLYPALLMLGAALLLGIKSKVMPKNGLVLFSYLMLLPILSQFAITHHNTGKWSFISPLASKDRGTEHLKSRLWGWDTRVINGQGVGVPYENGCLRGGDGLIGAIQAKDWSVVVCFLTQRQNFYFGSYLGHSYILAANERVFSKWILLANMLAITLLFAAMFSGGRFWLLAFPMAFMLGNWGLAGVIVPESRFMMGTYMFIWACAPALLLGWLAPAPASSQAEG